LPESPVLFRPDIFPLNFQRSSSNMEEEGSDRGPGIPSLETWSVAGRVPEMGGRLIETG